MSHSPSEQRPSNSSNQSACYGCKSTTAELRPYGPQGQLVCFSCAFATPERKRQTEAAFSGLLQAAGPVGVLAKDGPVPHRDYGKKLS